MLISTQAEPSYFRADHAALLERYDTYFSSRKADTLELMDRAFALRYQVYCLERQFEDPSQHYNRLETDAFDPQAVHALVFHRPTAEAIGTARLILSPRETARLPVLDILRAGGLDGAAHFPLHTTAEVSRFAITRQFVRARHTQSANSSNEADGQGAPRDDSRTASLPCLGLIQSLVRLSIECGVTHWAAMMEPKLLRMLAIMGIHFTPLGPLVSHHGLRQPCYCNLADMLETLLFERPDNWIVVTNAGGLSCSMGQATKLAA